MKKAIGSPSKGKKFRNNINKRHMTKSIEDSKNKVNRNLLFDIDSLSSKYSVTITRGSDGKFGLKYTGNKITGVTSGGPAEVAWEIVPGDRIIRVNNHEISDGITTKQIGSLIQGSGTSLCLEIRRGNDEYRCFEEWSP